MTVLYTFILIYLIMNIVGFGAWIASDSPYEFDYDFNPFEIYHNSELNWFGVWLKVIFTHLLVPLVAIFYWLYKLLTL